MVSHVTAGWFPWFRLYLTFVIKRDAISHLISHFLHKQCDLVIRIPNVLPNDNDAFVFELLPQLVEMGNGVAARPHQVAQNSTI